MKENRLGFWNHDLNTTIGGRVTYYQTTSNPSVIQQAKNDMKFFLWKDYQVASVFVVTYTNVSDKAGRVSSYCFLSFFHYCFFVFHCMEALSSEVRGPGSIPPHGFRW